VTRASDKGPIPVDLRRWVARRLLAWFRHHARILPWRRDRDPYRIWVSEVMLQQTQVATVVGYFERFLTAFPTLPALATADEQDVLRLWEGLGYYRRARDLHRAARLIVERHDGTIPDDPELLADLPGLGRYTVNAVLSQAFDRSLPILEANSQRVLSRLFARAEDPRQGPARRWLWDAAAQLVPAREAGAFNQALMELGALVCTPTTPRCEECPLAARCEAHQQGAQERIPARAPAPVPTQVREVAIVIRRGEHILVVQRPSTATRWANLWEFPHGEVVEGEPDESAAQRLARELTGLEVRLGSEVATIRHGVTRFRITIVCFEAAYESGEFASPFHVEGRWLTAEQLSKLPFSTPQRRLARLFAQSGRQGRLF
jgi:A/G-specific adenine glycosylase